MSWTLDDNGTIKVTRNDTPTFPIEIYVENYDFGELHPYQPGEGDEIVFAIKESKEDPEPLVVIPIPNDTLELTFPEHWADDLELGKYYYEVSLNNGTYHETFIEGKRLIITMEIYGG